MPHPLPVSPGATPCAVIGTNNNRPNGLTNSPRLSASAGAANTGIPAGTFAQPTHADGTATAPNWLGAAGLPQFVHVRSNMTNPSTCNLCPK